MTIQERLNDNASGERYRTRQDLELTVVDKQISYYFEQRDANSAFLSTTFPNRVLSSGRVVDIPQTISRVIFKDEINRYGPANKPWRWIKGDK